MTGDSAPRSRQRSVALAALAVCALLIVAALFTSRGQAIRSRALTWIRMTELAALSPIDVHTHVLNTSPEFTGMLSRLHMRLMDILYVDDTTPHLASLDASRSRVLQFVSASAGRAQFCTTFDPFLVERGDFYSRALEALQRDFDSGAVAVKVWKNVGMEVQTDSHRYLLPDDPVWEPIYQAIAARKTTLVIHAADPDTAWGAPAGIYAKYYASNPQWQMSGKNGAPAKEDLLRARDRVLALHPDLRVVGAHLGSLEDRLDVLAATLDRHPNFAVDTAARLPSLMLADRARVRAFFLKYQDRILYGTDLGFLPGADGSTAAARWRRQYLADWRYLATSDSFTYQGIQVRGLALPRTTLQKLYHDNALRWIPGLAGNKRH